MSVIAERVWDMIVDTHIDNLVERTDGTIAYDSLWKRDMMQGIERILAEEMAPRDAVVDAAAEALTAARNDADLEVSPATDEALHWLEHQVDVLRATPEAPRDMFVRPEQAGGRPA